MNVYGYIRFSYFGRNDTKIGRGELSEEERFDALYNPSRMKDRFYFFENITLPSIRVQTDQDFRVIVATSHIMPKNYRVRLEELCAGIPQIDILYNDDQHISDALKPKIAEMTAGLNEKSVHFRLDDDDAIANHVIASLKAYAQNLNPGTLISLSRGLYLCSDSERSYLVRKLEPYIAIAWSLINAPGQIRSPYDKAHGAYYMNSQSFMDSQKYSYIHVAHDASDTQQAQGRKLARAIAFDRRHDTQRGRDQIAKIVDNNFPCFTAEKLHGLIRNVPSFDRNKSS